MSKCFKIGILLTIFGLLVSTVYAVTRDELINKVIEAGNFIKQKNLKTAIQKVEDLNGPYIWNNNINYLFIMDINGKMVAHPFRPDLKKPDNLLNYKDKKGKSFFIDFIEVAKSANGMGWVKYMWPLPGETEPIPKYTFVYRVPGTDYLVCSGLYVIKPGEYY